MKDARLNFAQCLLCCRSLCPEFGFVSSSPIEATPVDQAIRSVQYAISSLCSAGDGVGPHDTMHFCLQASQDVSPPLVVTTSA